MWVGGEWGPFVHGRNFESTAWTVVLAARDAHTTVSRELLNTLCATYWKPLYSYIRHCQYSREEAEDLTQEFFARFLEYNSLQDVAPEKGKFRTFLLVSLRHFLANERAKIKTQKRGGDWVRVSMDFVNAEQLYIAGPAHDLSPEILFDAEWARTVIESVVTQLESEFLSSDKPVLFQHLKGHLFGRKEGASYKALGETLHMSENAVKAAVHRARKRCGELLCAEIMKTVATCEDMEEEIRHLINMAGV